MLKSTHLHWYEQEETVAQFLFVPGDASGERQKAGASFLEHLALSGHFPGDNSEPCSAFLFLIKLGCVPFISISPAPLAQEEVECLGWNCSTVQSGEAEGRALQSPQSTGAGFIIYAV